MVALGVSAREAELLVGTGVNLEQRVTLAHDLAQRVNEAHTSTESAPVYPVDICPGPYWRPITMTSRGA